MSLLALSALLAGGHADQQIVAFGPDGAVSFGAFRRDVAATMDRLDKGPAGPAMLVCRDSYLFLVGLYALLQTGHAAVLPPNDQPGTLAAYRRRVTTFLTDQDLDLDTVRVQHGGAHGAARFAPLDPDMARIDFFTSGSSGEPKQIAKSLRQLETELEIVDGLFGRDLGAAAAFATVTHQHIFGLTFKLLWSIASGRPFARRQYHVWEQAFADLTPGALVVTSPAHLTRLAGLAPLAAERRPRMVLMGGAPLSYDAAEDVRRVFGQLPQEFFGSTETGVIGLRRQNTPDALWQPFPGVRLQIRDGDLLRVASPLLASHEQSLDLADRVAIEPGGFRLLGRADRIVKIEAKRVSLSEVEAQLAALPWIAEAVVTTINEPRPRLGAVAVLTPEGQAELNAHGKFRFERMLSKALAQTQDQAGVPKRWRFVETFPTDGMGKRKLADLRALLEDDEKPAVTEPYVAELAPTADGIDLILDLSPNLLYFQGHFPGAPILPGVVQLDWAVRFAQQHLQAGASAPRDVQIKFKKVIQPAARVTLSLRYERERSRLRFSYRDAAGEEHSSGSLLFPAP